MQQLAKDTSLQSGKYKIEKVLGQGGFGITYLATQDLLNRKVCIKEFFFKEYCERDETTSHITLGTSSNQEFVERFMKKFIKEARIISQLDHPNIIKIHDIFKENNTAYYVMDYIEGETLSQIVERKGKLSEEKALEYVHYVADALKYIHDKNINHLDIKPSNIMIKNNDDAAVLIDFGLSKQYDESGSQTSSTPLGISQGYAPLEQYMAGGVDTFSPQSDIYALGATLYKLVTGITPPSATEILNNGLPKITEHIQSSTLDAITKALQPKIVNRTQTIEEFCEQLLLTSIHTNNKAKKGNNGPTDNYFQTNSSKEDDESTSFINDQATRKSEDIYVLKLKANQIKTDIYMHTMRKYKYLRYIPIVLYAGGIITSKHPDLIYSYVLDICSYLFFIGLIIFENTFIKTKTTRNINVWLQNNKDNPVCLYLYPINFSYLWFSIKDT